MAVKRSTSPAINANSENILRIGDSGRYFVSARNVRGRIIQNRSNINTDVDENRDHSYLDYDLVRGQLR